MFAIGDRVEAYGLMSDGGKCLNGERGIVIRRDATTGRWCVQFDCFSEGKKIKEDNLSRVQGSDSVIRPHHGLARDFLHYFLPFDATSPEEHGCQSVKTSIILCYTGCVVVYCSSPEEANMVDSHCRRLAAKCKGSTWMTDGHPRYAVVTEANMISFERSRIVTLINFGVPSVSEYERRLGEVFCVTADWPMSEPRGVVVNLVPSMMSKPYTKLKFDNGMWQLPSEPLPSFFVEDDPDSLHDPNVNTFDRPKELNAIIAGGIRLKPFGDEMCAGNNIAEWHLMLGHRAGRRSYWYLTDWTWTGAAPDRDAEDPVISVNLADILNPLSATSARLEKLTMEGRIRIPPHLSAKEVVEFIKTRR